MKRIVTLLSTDIDERPKRQSPKGFFPSILNLNISKTKKKDNYLTNIPVFMVI